MFISALGAVALTNQALTEARSAMVFLGMILFVGLTISRGGRISTGKALLCAAFPTGAFAGVLYCLAVLYGLGMISAMPIRKESALAPLRLVSVIAILGFVGNVVAILMTPALIDAARSTLRIAPGTMKRTTQTLRWTITVLLLFGAIATVITTGEAPEGIKEINPTMSH
jgi:hypothetical protein